MTNKVKVAYDLYKSGFVNRYHTHYDVNLRNAQDLTDAHSNRMIKLGLVFFPSEMTANVLACIAMHDAGEIASGDSPWTSKREYPDLKNILDVIEGNQLAEFWSVINGLFGEVLLTPRERSIIKLLDQLESFCLQSVLTPYRMHREHRLLEGMRDQALSLGVLDEFNLFIDHVISETSMGEH